MSNLTYSKAGVNIETGETLVEEMVISYVYPFYLFTAYSSSGPVQA
jgi:hypothetical protein